MESIDSLFDQLEPFKDQPLDRWNPAKSVEIDIRIDRNGVWFYQGSPITRHRIVKLFSTVLRLEDGYYFLVTPPVKYKIQVEDVPFNAVELKQLGDGVNQTLHLRTNMDDVIRIDLDHPIRMVDDSVSGSLIPYVHVRDGLQARVVRSVYYQIAELVEQNPWGIDRSSLDEVGIVSSGKFFPLDSTAEP
jgi:hypothetical protein